MASTWNATPESTAGQAIEKEATPQVFHGEILALSAVPWKDPVHHIAVRVVASEDYSNVTCPNWNTRHLQHGGRRPGAKPAHFAPPNRGSDDAADPVCPEPGTGAQGCPLSGEGNGI